jgi:chemotaxis protein methyltransferase CheR
MNPLLSTPAARQSLTLLRDLIEEVTGNYYSDQNLDLLAMKLENRLAELGLLTYLDYYYLLRYDPAREQEWPLLESAVTVNETYFWRESAALRLAARELLPEIRARQKRPPRIWHAACASGEEAYSMVMALQEAEYGGPVDILASDLDRKVLEMARIAIYRERSVRPLPPGWLERYFEALPGERWALKPEVAGRVSFRRLNLIDGSELERLPQYDLIFLRNVLLYFRSQRVLELLERLKRVLSPGGCLMVGASESLLRFAPPLDFEERRGVVLYRNSSCE